MERARFEPTWPFLCVLIGLFVLSALSPRAWQRAMEDRPTGPTLATAAMLSPEEEEPDPLPDEGLDVTLLASSPLPAAEAEWTVAEKTPLEVAVEPIGRFEFVEPAPKLASRVVELPAAEPEPPGPVLPSRGGAVPKPDQHAPESEWLPLPALVGPMAMAAGAAFDPAVLPVRRPKADPPESDGREPSGTWPEPESFYRMLDELAWDCQTGPWAREVARLVRALGRAVDGRSPQFETILADLNELGNSADKLAVRLTDRALATRLLRAQHAFGRRLDLWQRAVRPGKPLSGGWTLAGRTSDQRLTAVDLLERLEKYESTGLNRDAQPLAEICRLLDGSAGKANQTFNRRLQTHYRNANLRIAATGILLNELIPEREPERMRVSDTVLGRPVYGRSTNQSEVLLRLIPDPERLRMELEVEGLFSSQTTSLAGPATFYSNSKAAYRAWREMELGTWGIHIWPTRVAVNNNTWLRSWETNFDGVPLVGALAHSVARNQHERNRPEAEREVEWKVASRVKRQFDEESQERLEKLSDLLEQRLFAPLERMSLEPVTVSSETTEERIVTRLRLATDDQLGSSTPRPEAPTDSLLSVQAHQSAINNVFEQLDLDGNTFTLAELRRHLAERLNRPEMAENAGDADGEQDDVTITFADRDAVNVRLDEGQVRITLAVAELTASARRWSDFQVRVFYRPEVEGRTVRLVRDEVIHLIGQLNLRSQIALRGIFSKTFHKDRHWVITPESLETDARFSGTAITQLALDDGWVGFALGPDPSDSEIARR